MHGGSLVRALFNFRTLTTLGLAALYGGGLVWALLHGKLDVQSFISGVGPSFGLALGYWFRDSAQGTDISPHAQAAPSLPPEGDVRALGRPGDAGTAEKDAS